MEREECYMRFEIKQEAGAPQPSVIAASVMALDTPACEVYGDT